MKNRILFTLLFLTANFLSILWCNSNDSDICRPTFNTGFKELERIVFFPSIRFEYFVVLLKNAKTIIGNSSAGVREAPFLGIPSVNIGSRQHRRSDAASIISPSYQLADIKSAIHKALSMTTLPSVQQFGRGNSDKKFIELLSSNSIWDTPRQKFFQDFIHWSEPTPHLSLIKRNR